MPTRLRLLLPIAATTLGVLASCVELPLERTNFFDPESGTRILMDGVPDTISSVGESFTVTLTLSPTPGSSVPLAAHRCPLPQKTPSSSSIIRNRSIPGGGRLSHDGAITRS